jgi:hypothetical protein
MVRRILVAGALASLVAAPASAAKAPLELEPSSKWNIDNCLERCTLMREFGSGASAVHLQIDSFGAWNAFRVLLNGSAIPRLDGPTGSAGVRRSGDPKPTELDTLQGNVGKTHALSFDLAFAPYISAETYRRMDDDEKRKWSAEMSRPQPDYDATVEWISVRARGTTMVLHTGSMARPLAAMRTCIDDMYMSWGVDPARQKALSQPARPTQSTVRKVQHDYPVGPRLNGTNAYVPVRLTVDATGQATSCVVQSEGVDEPFKAAVCEHLQGSFEPALDAEGKPAASIYHTAVFYLVNGWH